MNALVIRGSEVLRLKKGIMTMATVTVFGLSSTLFVDSIQAETLGNLTKQKSEIVNERSNLQSKLSKAESELADLLVDLDEINEKIAESDEKLAENKQALEDTKKNIAETEEKIEELEDSIAELEEKIEKRFELLKDRISSLQKNGGDVGYLDVIFGSKSFSDMITRTSAVNKITDSDAELMEQLGGTARRRPCQPRTAAGAAERHRRRAPRRTVPLRRRGCDRRWP